jgi:hypothetical protein
MRALDDRFGQCPMTDNDARTFAIDAAVAQ